VFPWTHRSTNSMKIPIIYPAASTTKIGATVTMLTSIVDGCSLCSFKTANCVKILSWIPLSRNCVNLWRKFFYIKSLMHCHFKISLQKYFSYGCVKSNEKLRSIINVQYRATVRYLNVLPLVVTKKNMENPPLRLDIRKNVWTEIFITWIMAILLQFTIYLTYSKLWQCH
jgi:hypothetical protein